MVLPWVSVLLVVLASCDSSSETDDGGNAPGDGSGDQPEGTLAGGSPYFNQRFVEGESDYIGVFLVVDRDDVPIKDAELRVGESAARTKDDGTATIAGVDSVRPEPIRVVADGYVPRVVLPRLADALRGETEVRLQRLHDPFEVDATERASLVRDGGQLQLQKMSLALGNGRRVDKAMVALEMLGGDQFGGSLELPDAGDEQQVIEAVLGGMFVEPKTEAGETLQLADDAHAVADIPIPDGSAAPGDRMQLASADEQQGTLKLEGECTVRAVGDADDAPLVCRGAVSHFSQWYVTLVKKNPRPIACVSWDIGDMGRDGIVDFQRLDCGGSRCEDRTGNFLPVVVLNGSEFVHWGKGWKGRVTHVGSDITHVVLVRSFERKDPVFRSRSGGRQTVRYLRDYALIELGKLGTLRADPNEDKEACSLRIELPTKWSKPDQDGDGSYPEWSLPPIYRQGILHFAGEDCDDLEHDVHPSGGRREWRLCDGVDNDCNPATPDSGRYTDFHWWEWNAICSKECAIREDEEIPGNLYDEDCDRRLADLDGDGADEAKDCDDLNAGAHPGADEVPSNQTDEDCDGEFVDFDGDGHLFTRHAWQIPEGQQADLPADDCNDALADVHGGREAGDEAGQLASFFAPDATRLRSYCDYFEADGSASSLFRSAFFDLDCDGHFTDLDGDGEDSPLDCDDTDPRVQPEGEGDDAMCSVPDDLENLTSCTAEPSGTGDRCPAILGGTRHSKCLPTMNADGTLSDISVCNFFGWETSEPLVPEPGVAWGPCDDGDLLPACGDGLQCAGGLRPFSPELRAELTQWTEGASLSFEGMCFPTCEP